jgi:hypothetical protein
MEKKEGLQLSECCVLTASKMASTSDSESTGESCKADWGRVIAERNVKVKTNNHQWRRMFNGMARKVTSFKQCIQIPGNSCEIGSTTPFNFREHCTSTNRLR